MHVKTRPLMTATDRGADAASRAASMFPSVVSSSFAANARDTIPVVARLRKENKYRSVSVHMVPGDRAARPADPTVCPTKALSILLSNGDAKNIPSAGTANFIMLRLLPLACFAGVESKDVASWTSWVASTGMTASDKEGNGKGLTMLEKCRVRHGTVKACVLESNRDQPAAKVDARLMILAW